MICFDCLRNYENHAAPEALQQVGVCCLCGRVKKCSNIGTFSLIPYKAPES